MIASCYRYLSSHWNDTLLKKRFLVSQPSRFNDKLDCAFKVVGALRQDVLDRYNTEFNWDDEACRHGLPLESVVYSKAAKGLDQNEICRLVFDDTRMAMDYNFRFLCLSKATAGDETANHMWKKYANGGEGVRIGLFLNLQERDDSPVKHVQYKDEPNVLDLSTLSKFPPTVGDVLKFICTKTKEWSIEAELRMIRQLGKWKDDDCDGKRLSFWEFPPQLVARIDLGCNFSGDVNQFVDKYSRIYPWADFYQCDAKEEVPRVYRRIRKGDEQSLPKQNVWLD